MNGSKLTCYH